jgi:hypothetical protein
MIKYAITCAQAMSGGGGRIGFMGFEFDGFANSTLMSADTDNKNKTPPEGGLTLALCKGCFGDTRHPQRGAGSPGVTVNYDCHETLGRFCEQRPQVFFESREGQQKQNATRRWRLVFGVPTGIRTPVIAVKGRCPRPLDDGDSNLLLLHCQQFDQPQLQPKFFGGDKQDRTADLLHAMQALSQLSYTPTNLPFDAGALIHGLLQKDEQYSMAIFACLFLTVR